MLDTHCHLFYPNYENDIDSVIENAIKVGIKSIIVPGTDLTTSKQAIELANNYDIVYAAVGVHPEDAKDWNSESINELREMATYHKVVAIGEIGLDYYWDTTPKDIQKIAFRKQLDLALELNLPVIIHNRDADNDTLEIIRSYKDSPLKAQFHCFSGSIEMARELVELRHYISFTGNITFSKANSLREIVKRIQIDNMLLETDSPFMSPHPLRGKRNEPANIPVIAEKIAEIQNISIDDVIRTTTYNAYKLFGIGKKPELVFTYKIGSSLYVNVTNRCNADCIFCDRKGEAVVSGFNLKMSKSEEPDAEIYISQIGDPSEYKEIVFCGFGEPTIRWDVVKQIAKYVKDNGGKTRMNTNGHGNVINKRDITPELKDLFDSISISLNSIDPVQYGKLMKVAPGMHEEMIDFASKAKNYTNVVMSVVGINEVDISKAKDLIENKIGTTFRLRELF